MRIKVYKNIEIFKDLVSGNYFVEGAVSEFRNLKDIKDLIDQHEDYNFGETDPDYIMGVDEYIDNNAERYRRGI